MTSPYSRMTRVPDLESGLHLPAVIPQNELLRSMACLKKDAPVTDFHDSSQAYFNLLDDVLKNIPDTMTASLRTTTLADTSPSDIRRRLYTILCVIAQMFRDEKKEVLLGDVCSKLEKKSLVFEDRRHTAQLVFILFGALTLLYVPIPNPEPGKLQMRASNLSSSVRRHSTATWHIGSQDLVDEDQEASFDDLLARYCRHQNGPIPRPLVRHHNVGHGLSGESKILRSHNVSFYTLDRLMKVQVCWTTSICEHLEFNLKTRTMKLFRLPSYCRILCLQEPDRTFLDSMFDRSLGDQREQLTASPKATDFFREVLSTYRLIFGQHKDSRKLIKKYTARGRLFGFKSPFRKSHPSALVNENADPLLERLCFGDSRDEDLFAELDMLNLKNTYVLDTDFPYFAERLWALQDFVENQCPSGWKVIWRDRRDIAKFWTLWAVLIFGAPSLALALLQSVLTGVQLRGGNSGPACVVPGPSQGSVKYGL